MGNKTDVFSQVRLPLAQYAFPLAQSMFLAHLSCSLNLFQSFPSQFRQRRWMYMLQSSAMEPRLPVPLLANWPSFPNRLPLLKLLGNLVVYLSLGQRHM